MQGKTLKIETFRSVFDKDTGRNVVKRFAVHLDPEHMALLFQATMNNRNGKAQAFKGAVKVERLADNA